MEPMVRAVMYPPLADLFERWRAYLVDLNHGARPVLRYFGDCADHLLVIDIDESFYTYRHYGQAFIDAFDVDLSNQTIEHVPFAVLPQERRHMLEFEYSFVHRCGRPVWRNYTAEFRDGTRTWQRLTLPVSPHVLIVGAYEIDPKLAPAPAADDDAGARLLRTVIDTVPVYLDEAGRVAGLAVTLAELTLHRVKEAELQYLATTDPLTGVSNRRRLMEVAEAEFERCRRYGQTMAILMADIDHFKAVNDTHGHAAGDEALRGFAAACREVLRRSDALGRCGGEEFAVILPSTDLAGAAIMAERLRARTETVAVEGKDGTRFGFTISVGAAALTPEDRSPADMLERADAMLYAAKHAGRNRVVVEAAEAGSPAT